MYARIKGIAEKDIPRVVDAKIAETGLTEYADRNAGTYSGGNKRKLSLAIAMIGEPSIVFLDGNNFILLCCHYFYTYFSSQVWQP